MVFTAPKVAERFPSFSAKIPVGLSGWQRLTRREIELGNRPTSVASTLPQQAVLQRDDYMCTVCDISGGEPYLDDSNQTAVLSVARVETILPGGTENVLLVTQCKRCRADHLGAPARADEVLARRLKRTNCAASGAEWNEATAARLP
ncbi:hypothetical protein ACGFI3_34610 [Nonomuraea wenchangensis]|uniref:hypothetical protein n=1 Tax=Nonomuraea wenchangensis TaxID=568860 RepID=UPI003721883A